MGRASSSKKVARGEDANLAAFAETTGLELSDGSLTLPSGETYEDGDDCGGEPGVVQVKVWSDVADQDGAGTTATSAP